MTWNSGAGAGAASVAMGTRGDVNSPQLCHRGNRRRSSWGGRGVLWTVVDRDLDAWGGRHLLSIPVSLAILPPRITWPAVYILHNNFRSVSIAVPNRLPPNHLIAHILGLM